MTPQSGKRRLTRCELRSVPSKSLIQAAKFLRFFAGIIPPRGFAALDLP